MEQKTEFQTWIAKIPHKDYSRVRDSIIKETEVSRTTFASWSRGESNPSLNNQIDIAFIAYQYNRSQVFNRLCITEKDGMPEMVIKQKEVIITATVAK